jgi:hypothetical protein
LDSAFVLRRNARYAAYKGKPVPTKQLEAALETVLARHAASDAGNDAKRIWAGYLTAKGELARARDVNAQLTSAGARPDRHMSYDIIHTAFLRRVTGTDANTFTAVMTNCPPPDAPWIARNGQPSPPSRFCEAVMSSLASSVLTAMGAAAPPAVGDVLTSLSHEEPQPFDHRSISAEAREGQAFGALANRLLEEAASMTRVQREQTAYRLRAVEHPSFEQAMRLLILRPEHDAGAAAVIEAALLSGSQTSLGVTFDIADYRKRAAGELIEKRAASGPDAAQWQRAKRNWLLYSGEFQQALALARRQLGKQPEAANIAALAALERVAGNRAGYDAAIAKCPGQSEESLRNGEPRVEQKTDFCRSGAWWVARRGIRMWREKSPAAFKELMVEMARDPVAYPMDVDALQTLRLADPKLAETEWDAMLRQPAIRDDVRTAGLRELVSIAVQLKKGPEGLRRVDQYLADQGFASLGFPENGWQRVASGPTLPQCAGCGIVEHLMRERLTLALMAVDFGRARESIEWMVEKALDNGDAWIVRESLLQLGDAYSARAMKSESLRLIGYLATTSLDPQQTAKLNAIRRRIGSEPKAETSPWDTKPSPPKRRAPPAPDTTKKS